MVNLHNFKTDQLMQHFTADFIVIHIFFFIGDHNELSFSVLQIRFYLIWIFASERREEKVSGDCLSKTNKNNFHNFSAERTAALDRRQKRTRNFHYFPLIWSAREIFASTNRVTAQTCEDFLIMFRWLSVIGERADESHICRDHRCCYYVNIANAQ